MMAIPKKKDQLTAEDFKQFSIWKLVDPSKSDVEPLKRAGNAPLLSLVAIECIAADGSVHPGFGILSKLAIIAPVVFAADTQIPLQGNSEPSPKFRKRAYELLQRRADQVFPLRIRMTVTSQHRPLPAIYDGFVYRTSDGSFATVQ